MNFFSSHNRRGSARLSKKERGFTIVEVLISLTIFSVAVAGVITVAVQGGLNVNASKLRVTANYLADEGVELMRAMRDTTVLGAGLGNESVGWTTFASVFGTTICADSVGGVPATPCDIDPNIVSSPFPNMSNVVACSVGGYCPLYYLPSGTYTDIAPTGARPSSYSRQILVTKINDDEVRVTVRVKYLEGLTLQTVVHTENLFNWY